MLSEDELEKGLCWGRIVHVENLPDSSGRWKAGPHFCIILSSNAQIKKSGALTVAAISSDKHDIEPVFRVPVPPRWGLSGFVIRSWLPEIHERQITAFRMVALAPEMKPILEMVRRYRESTQS